MPLEGAIPASNSEIASSPPAEAPIPTTVNDGVDSSSAVAMVSPLLRDEVQSSSIRRLWSGDAEQKTKWAIKHYHLKAETG